VSSSVWAEINLDGITKRIEFFVVVKCVVNADLLIGQNFTELDDISYIKTGYTLQFYENQVVNSLQINTPQLNTGNNNPKIVDQLLSLLNEHPACVAIDLADIEDDRWDENVVNIKLGLNGAVNEAISVTPSEALLGFRVSTDN
jgi:hypothetical protein